MWWAGPQKWRRVIRSSGFSQVLDVNGNRVFEQDSDGYFPIELYTLITAMVNPGPILRTYTPGGELLTKANGSSNESGTVCLGDSHRLCMHYQTGLTEMVALPGQRLNFTEYQGFHGIRVARFLTDSVGVGEFMRADITELSILDERDDSFFSIARPTPAGQQIRIVTVPEQELQSSDSRPHVIVWPQALDGSMLGTASFLISIDRSGRVREVLPVRTDNERTNDSAHNQIMRWTFKPLVHDGLPVQALSLVTFNLNTRAWGPRLPLTDEEVRELASDEVTPIIPSGSAPSGAAYTIRVAIDSDGNLIEVIPATPEYPALFQPCLDAVRKWRFRPILKNGQALPYRAEITFHVP